MTQRLKITGIYNQTSGTYLESAAVDGYVDATNLHMQMILNASQNFEWQLYEYYDASKSRDPNVDPKYESQAPNPVKRRKNK